MKIRALTYSAIIARILSAFFLGGIIGLERGMKNRPAGLRTYMLVCIGSCLIMMTNQYLYQASGAGDPGRMGAQVVSGIGFLGAGTIVVTKRSQIKGLTTAAGLWAAAAVGLALGIGFYEAAFLGSITIFTVLSIMHSWDNLMRKNTKVVDIYLEIAGDASLGDCMRSLREIGLDIESIQLEHDSTTEDGTRSFIATLHSMHKENHDVLLSKIRSIKGVAYLEEL